MPGDGSHVDDERMRFGIIGCAAIARKLCRAISLSPNAVLRAIGSRSLEKARAFAGQNGLSSTDVRLYGSYEEVVGDPSVDAVYIPLPTSLHLEWAVLAARNKKHVLLEKPAALSLLQLDRILEACSSNGVQFMDGTMWLHHPRTAGIGKLVSESEPFGRLESVHSTSTFCATPEFLDTNIRTNPDLDGLGALGDLGWYSIGSILWAAGYKLPTSVLALPRATLNPAGVILACSASLIWDNHHPRTIATFHCSFLAHKSMDLTMIGTDGSVHVTDLAIPIEEGSASFDFTRAAKFVDMHIGWSARPESVWVSTEIPQEALMVRELAGLVLGMKKTGCGPEGKWPGITRKTQVVMDAVKKSIDLGYVPVNL